jgi:hypothetical protein
MSCRHSHYAFRLQDATMAQAADLQDVQTMTLEQISNE